MSTETFALSVGVVAASGAYLCLGDVLVCWMEQYMGPVRPRWARPFALLLWPWFLIYGLVTGAFFEFWRESRRTSPLPVQETDQGAQG